MKKQLLTLVTGMMIFNSCGSVIYNGYKPLSNSKNEVIYKKQNEFNDYNYYRHKTMFLSISTSPIYLYVSEKDNKKYLRAEFRYDGADWIFFKKATLLNSNKSKMSFSFDSFKRETNVKYSGNGVSEEYDVSLDESQAKELLSLLNSNEGKIKLRLEGDNNLKDYVLKKSHIESFKELLDFYFRR